MNLVEYLARATEYLDRHGISSPRLNAELLLADMLGISRLDIYTRFERQLTAQESDAFRDLVVKRSEGIPLQYITGETGFRGLTLAVREGVFIPRPETEVLVELALENAPVTPGAGGPFSVLDIGTGCGNIAVSIAAEREDASVVAIDCDARAVELCLENAAKAVVASRVSGLVGDLFGPLDDGATFDLIISNPPYIPESMRDELPAEVRDFEPEKALFGGQEGLDTIRKIVAGAPERLAPRGLLALEVDLSHAEQVALELLEGLWSSAQVYEDLAGRKRVVLARHGEPGC
ncbi:MAG: peptide chain release factor N(5)-glutamine methyltransferase [Candidatus Geothermincolia bacterium]